MAEAGENAYRLAARDCHCILLLQSETEDNRKIYFFLKVRGDRVLDLRRAMASTLFNPRQFGEVLLQAEGEPTEADFTYMREHHGFEQGQMVALPAEYNAEE